MKNKEKCKEIDTKIKTPTVNLSAGVVKWSKSLEFTGAIIGFI